MAILLPLLQCRPPINPMVLWSLSGAGGYAERSLHHTRKAHAYFDSSSPRRLLYQVIYQTDESVFFRGPERLFWDLRSPPASPLSPDSPHIDLAFFPDTSSAEQIRPTEAHTHMQPVRERRSHAMHISNAVSLLSSSRFSLHHSV